MDFKKFALSLPYPVQQPLRHIYGAIPPSIRYGKGFWETHNFLQESQWWGKKELQAYQLLNLNQLITFCSNYVPFYQKRWAEFGVNIRSINDFTDLRKLPFTTKEDIRKFAHEMVPVTLTRKNLIESRTGGTTGSPATFYYTKRASQSELAFFVMFLSWHGCNFFRDRIAFFRGSYQRKERIEHIGNLYYLPTWNLSRNRLSEYIKFINARRISFIHGYPSLVYELFKTSQEAGVTLKTVKAVSFASEKPYDYQKHFIEQCFDVPVYCHYGHQEWAALFLQCRSNDAYHVISQYGYTELEAVENEELFEIISTGFINLATPLIRYRTEDYAILIDEAECDCGRKYPKTVKDVVGRTGDLIVTPSGKIIQPNHLEYAIRYIRHFSDCQIIQDQVDHLRVLVVPNEGYTSDEGERFKRAILWRLSEDMGLDIELVDSISRPPNLKKRFTVNLTKGAANGEDYRYRERH